jgi:uncharacterized phage protein (TIGR02218 family)
VNGALEAHLAAGPTTVCRCWKIVRRDGAVLGFTDHDAALTFEGVRFEPGAGLSAGALAQGTGLAVDNGEAMGVLSADSISAADLEAGRYDGAAVSVWLVNWADVAARQLLFAGRIGEVRRGGGAFHAELRGLSEGLNRAGGRAYMRHCPAVLGDERCRFDLAQPGYRVTWRPVEVERGQRFVFAHGGGVQPRWFERGRLFVLEGAATGLEGVIKHDQADASGRRIIELWEPVRAPVVAGEAVRLEAGCDKRAETCRSKFANIVNFRGFPFVPGEDWLVAVPATQPGVVAG